MCVVQVAGAIPWGLTATATATATPTTPPRFLLEGLIILLVLTAEVTRDSKD